MIHVWVNTLNISFISYTCFVAELYNIIWVGKILWFVIMSINDPGCSLPFITIRPYIYILHTELHSLYQTKKQF